MAMEARPRVLHVSVAHRTPAHRYREDGPDPTRTNESSSPRARRPMLHDMEITPRRRRTFATVLAVVLAIESVSAVAAAGLTTTALREAPGAAPTPVVAAVPAVFTASTASPARRARVSVASMAGQTPTGRRAPAIATTRVATVGITKPAASGHAKADRPSHRIKTTKPRVTARPPAASKRVKAATFAGRNHVWIPALGMNRSVSSFACSRSREPDNYVYRWGCAGSNNVYLLGHAWGVFKPLHDAYTSGRLMVGLKVWYADANGRVTGYAVRWWRVVKPTTAASWAWASLPTRSMTLQTCVGARSQNRLMVRLTAVD
jgi:hypothetical protein